MNKKMLLAVLIALAMILAIVIFFAAQSTFSGSGLLGLGVVGAILGAIIGGITADLCLT